MKLLALPVVRKDRSTTHTGTLSPKGDPLASQVAGGLPIEGSDKN